MKKVCLLLSLFAILLCTGCTPAMKPIIEGTYFSYDESSSETFSKAKFSIKEITKEEYEKASEVNVFIDESTNQNEEKRYLSIELYLYAIETEKYELITLSNIECNFGSKHCYTFAASTQFNNKVYETEHSSIAFYYLEDDKAHAVITLKEKKSEKEITFRSIFKVE